MAYLSFNTSFSPLTVFEAEGAIIALEWGRAGEPDEDTDGDGKSVPVLIEAQAQLKAYLVGNLQKFDVPVRPFGTPFQQAVWKHMTRIGYGQTRTYGDIAKRLKSSPRAVGGACGRNPIPIIIPCHRIVGANGNLGGYSGGSGLVTKQALLTLEGGA